MSADALYLKLLIAHSHVVYYCGEAEDEKGLENLEKLEEIVETAQEWADESLALAQEIAEVSPYEYDITLAEKLANDTKDLAKELTSKYEHLLSVPFHSHSTVD